jgi:hypothetical protein
MEYRKINYYFVLIIRKNIFQNFLTILKNRVDFIAYVCYNKTIKERYTCCCGGIGRHATLRG